MEHNVDRSVVVLENLNNAFQERFGEVPSFQIIIKGGPPPTE